MRLFKRNLLRFSLRTALCLFLVAGMAFGWIGRHMREHWAEQRVIAEINGSTTFWPPPRTIRHTGWIANAASTTNTAAASRLPVYL